MNNKKAAVFIILGQSNAVGHGIPMQEEDIISKPLNNVFGLSREYNQSFDNNELVWSGYTSFGMNLAEEQDNTYSVVNHLAKIWQEHIDLGNKNNLPDLYIIQIAIGAQGVTDGNMWHPEREMKLIPGKLDKVDISLFPFTKHIFGLVNDSFKKKDIDYEVIGLHWRGGENDAAQTKEYLCDNLEKIYCQIFDELNAIFNYPPTILHKLVCGERFMDLDNTGKQLENMHVINSVFKSLVNKYENISMFDPTRAPQYDPNIRGNGLFIKDVVHFTSEVNLWVAECVLQDYIDRG